MAESTGEIALHEASPDDERAVGRMATTTALPWARQITSGSRFRLVRPGAGRQTYGRHFDVVGIVCLGQLYNALYRVPLDALLEHQDCNRCAWKQKSLPLNQVGRDVPNPVRRWAPRAELPPEI